MDCKLIENQLLDYLDGNLSDPESQALDEHIQTCSQCMQQLKIYRTLLDEAKLLEKHPAPESLWNKIENKLDGSVSFSGRIGAGLANLKDFLEESLRLPAPVFPLAGAVLLVVIGILIGSYWFPAQRNQPDLAVEPEDDPKIELISKRTDAFLEKSKVLFLGIINSDPDFVEDRDWSSEKKLAQNLVQEASYLKKSLSGVQNARLEVLVEELEVILLEIANLKEEYDMENIELIKSGIDHQALMLKINIHDMREGNLFLGKKRKTRAL